MLFPFFSLYITQKFNVGMTQAGIVLGIFALSGLFGQMIGGALTDKFGRRNLIIFGLIFSALSTLTLGLVKEFSVLIPLAMVIGLLSDIAGPAHSAMIADILPEQKRQEGFGILRVVGNPGMDHWTDHRGICCQEIVFCSFCDGRYHQLSGGFPFLPVYF